MNFGQAFLYGVYAAVVAAGFGITAAAMIGVLGLLARIVGGVPDEGEDREQGTGNGE